jgi:hypothetical protein
MPKFGVLEKVLVGVSPVVLFEKCCLLNTT